MGSTWLTCLHKGEASFVPGIPTQEQINCLKPFHYTLGVIQAVDADANEFLPQVIVTSQPIHFSSYLFPASSS